VAERSLAFLSSSAPFVSLPLFTGILLLTGIAWWPVRAELASESRASPTPGNPNSNFATRLAPFNERLAAAKSVKVQTNVFGIELDSPLEMAHAKLDSLGDPAKPPMEAKKDAGDDEEGHKVVWQLAKSDFSSIYVKADREKRITYIMGSLRNGKELPFDKIGELNKAPVLSNSTVAWDVVRPGRPLIRVIARGANRKAESITLFIVKRAPHH
jgi:hypothetical protein